LLKNLLVLLILLFNTSPLIILDLNLTILVIQTTLVVLLLRLDDPVLLFDLTLLILLLYLNNPLLLLDLTLVIPLLHFLLDLLAVIYAIIRLCLCRGLLFVFLIIAATALSARVDNKERGHCSRR